MQRRLFFSFLIVLVVGILICGLISVRVIEGDYNNSIEQRLISNAYLLREIIGEDLIHNKNIDASSYLARIKNAVNLRITVIALDGSVISDTDKDSATMDNHGNRPEVIEAYKGVVGVSRRYSSTVRVEQLYVALPIYANKAVIGVLRLSSPLYEIESLLRKLYFGAATAIVTALLIASILGYRIAYNITKPIIEMKEIASVISNGRFERRINVGSGDEIGDLANSINNMADRLRETISSLNDKNVKMEAILSSVASGIIAIDNSERILFANPVAIEVLNIEKKQIEGKHFLQAVRNNQLYSFLKSIIKSSSYVEKEIHISYPVEKTLKFYTNPIRHMDKDETIGVILSISDITELRKLERMRTEFVANVSHELKTPLTSIKGFVETLKSGALEDEKTSLRFLGIIEDEADRLNRLISDILSLSELENKKSKGVLERVELKHLICVVASMLNDQAIKKGIELTTNVQKDLKEIAADSDKIKQMLINLVDNAIKYTPDHGRVTIEAVNSDTGVRVSIEDNGIGIPEEHIPRLFERFYRVDKARSRNVGGTGLGLTIVKHIVANYNGEIKVQSQIGKGTRFDIALPEKQSL